VYTASKKPTVKEMGKGERVRWSHVNEGENCLRILSQCLDNGRKCRFSRCDGKTGFEKIIAKELRDVDIHLGVKQPIEEEPHRGSVLQRGR